MSKNDYTAKELAEELGIDKSRVLKMLSNTSQRRFMGAYRKGRMWLIPKPFKDPRQLKHRRSE